MRRRDKVTEHAILRRTFAWGLLVPALVLVATSMAVVIEPLPEVLRVRQYGQGLIVKDAGGRVLGQIRGSDYGFASPVRLADVPGHVQGAVIAAEDARFYRHRGIDPLAIGRAAWQFIRQRRIVSGASTITQQLARSVVRRPRTFYGKWREMVVSLRIEADLGKSDILEAYLNHVPFGPTTRGIGAAADEYFGKPLTSLSVAEAATLAALPKGPVRYHPRRQGQRLLGRRNYIVERMLALQLIGPEAARLALLEPAMVRKAESAGRAPHLLRAIAQGRFDDATQQFDRAALVRTTLDRDLQQQVEKLVEDAPLEQVGASAAAVVVVDNAQAELLAYVGSIDFFDLAGLGQNDGCMALRQPGSALKPFLYAAAIEWLGMGPATQLADVETKFQTPSGPFTPRNYDGRYHGLVLLREALGASLNVPAVSVTERVGVERLLALLHDVGFRSLTEAASHYGLAIALGDGEVRLVELAEAYSTLARHGLHRPLRVVTDWTDLSGQHRALPVRSGKQVILESTAWQLLEILSDDAARAPSFGRHGTLEMPFAAAVKTGTSSNHRDNWAVAVTHEITVAVWVGNFDGRPLGHGVSGVVGAAPLLRSVAQAAMRGRHGAALFPQERLLSRRICRISGQRPGPDCPDAVEIRAISGHASGDVCTLHRRVWLDSKNGLLAGPGCRDAVERTIERYPEVVMDWARGAGRPIGPTEESPRCPGASAIEATNQLDLRIPESEARYLLDPHIPVAQQSLRFAVKASPQTAWVEYEIDGSATGRIVPPFHWMWALRPGTHLVKATSSRGARDEARFSVE